MGAYKLDSGPSRADAASAAAAAAANDEAATAADTAAPTALDGSSSLTLTVPSRSINQNARQVALVNDFVFEDLVTTLAL